jgi:hypothetical protein
MKAPDFLRSMDADDAVVRTAVRRVWWMAGIAALLKLLCAALTLGTVDIGSFFHFGQVILEKGLPALYGSEPLFNHTPLVGWFSALVFKVTGGSPRWFAFLFRIPSIAADLVAVGAVLRVLPMHTASARWGALLFAASPVSFMVSGFHGNMDPVMTCLLVLAAAACVAGGPVRCAIFLALACNAKVAALVIGPLFFLHWLSRREGLRFALACAGALLVAWSYPLIVCARPFAEHVLGYGSYWGIWGITYWLEQAAGPFGWPQFAGVRFGEFTFAQRCVIGMLKAVIIGATLLLSWRSRHARGPQVFVAIAQVWTVFMVFAPGAAAQYLVWPAPFLLMAGARRYAWVTAACATHLVIFYTVLSGGFPWYFGIARAATNPIWMLSANIAWLAFMLCLASMMKAAPVPSTAAPAEGRLPRLLPRAEPV